MGMGGMTSFKSLLAAVAICVGTADMTEAQDSDLTIPPIVPPVPKLVPVPTPDNNFSRAADGTDQSNPSDAGLVTTDRLADLAATITSIIGRDLSSREPAPVNNNQLADILDAVLQAHGVKGTDQLTLGQELQELENAGGFFLYVLENKDVNNRRATVERLVIGEGRNIGGDNFEVTGFVTLIGPDPKGKQRSPSGNIIRFPDPANKTAEFHAQKPVTSTQTFPAEVELSYYPNCYPTVVVPENCEVSWWDPTKYQLPDGRLCRGPVKKQLDPQNNEITGNYAGVMLPTKDTLVQLPPEVALPILFERMGVSDAQVSEIPGVYYSTTKGYFGFVNPYPNDPKNSTVECVNLEIRIQDPNPSRETSLN